MRPDLLLLLGPFVDVQQPMVATGLLDVTFQQLFATQARAQRSSSMAS